MSSHHWRSKPNELHCHVMLRSVAIEMAGELYDEMMKDNSIWEDWQRVCPELDRVMAEAKFIELLWPLLVRNGSVRATLAQALASPSLPEDAKWAIHEALCLDSGLTVGRKPKRLAPRMKVNLNA